MSECLNEDEDELQKSSRLEPLFRTFVFHEINEFNEISEFQLINSGAEDIGISPVTAKRYLNKMCSNRGLLERVKRVKSVMIRYKNELR
ncbi:MAG: hypothetical protein ACW9W4_00715 [Candidatus Nitrosopumilus sp. bin_7KS]